MRKLIETNYRIVSSEGIFYKGERIWDEILEPYFGKLIMVKEIVEEFGLVYEICNEDGGFLCSHEPVANENSHRGTEKD